MRAFWLGRDWLLTPLGRRHDRKRAERALGRPLKPTQPVHHHSITQLVICESTDYHWLLHRRERVLRRGGHPATDRLCDGCNSIRPMADFKGDWCDYCRSAQVLWWALLRLDCTVYGAFYERVPTLMPEPTWGGKPRAQLEAEGEVFWDAGLAGSR